MKEPIWIRFDVVLAIHAMQIAEHGGKEGVLNEAALDAALVNPKHYFIYAEPRPDIPATAARHAHSIMANHPFYNGNKRTAAVVCELFLELNGYELNTSDGDAYAMYIRLASSKAGADEFADWLRENNGRAGYAGGRA